MTETVQVVTCERAELYYELHFASLSVAARYVVAGFARASRVDLATMGAVWDTLPSDSGRKWHFWHPCLLMGVVWDTLPMVLSAKWHIWHPCLLMGVVWDTLPMVLSAKWHIWHPYSLMGVVWPTLPPKSGRRWRVWHPLRDGDVVWVSFGTLLPRNWVADGTFGTHSQQWVPIGPPGGVPAH